MKPQSSVADRWRGDLPSAQQLPSRPASGLRAAGTCLHQTGTSHSASPEASGTFSGSGWGAPVLLSPPQGQLQPHGLTTRALTTAPTHQRGQAPWPGCTPPSRALLPMSPTSHSNRVTKQRSETEANSAPGRAPVACSASGHAVPSAQDATSLFSSSHTWPPSGRTTQ